MCISTNWAKQMPVYKKESKPRKIRDTICAPSNPPKKGKAHQKNEKREEQKNKKEHGVSQKQGTMCLKSAGGKLTLPPKASLVPSILKENRTQRTPKDGKKHDTEKTKKRTLKGGLKPSKHPKANP